MQEQRLLLVVRSIEDTAREICDGERGDVECWIVG